MRGHRGFGRGGLGVLSITGWVAVLCAAGCGDDEPELAAVLGSEHFEVQVSPGAPLRPDMLETLEEHYRVTRAFLKFPEGRVIYSLLASLKDAQQACEVTQFPAACTQGNHVYTTSTFDQHELIHAYMSFVAEPAPILQEGIAEGVICSELSNVPASAIEVVPWQTALSTFPTGRRDVYDTAFYLFVHLVQRFGIDAFVDYYRHAPRTLDPNVFRADFEAFWDVPLDSFWQELAQSRDGLPGLAPVCPCTQTPTVPIDGRPLEISARDTWMVGDVDLVPPDGVFPFPDDDPGAYTIVSHGGLSLRSCWQDRKFDLSGYAIPGSDAVIVARLAPERHYLAFTALEATSASVTKGDFVTATCDAARTITLPPGASGEIGVRIAAGDATQAATNEWYWRVAVGDLSHVTVSPPAVGATKLTVCPSCDQGSPACVTIPTGGSDFAMDATTPELVFRVVDPPDAYYLGIQMTLTKPSAPPLPMP